MTLPMGQLQAHEYDKRLDDISPNDSYLDWYYGNNYTGSKSGKSAGGSSSATAAESSGSSADAIISMLLQQQIAAEKRLRDQMNVANAAIDRNADYAIEQMDQDRIDQQRQSYISKEKALTAMPQAALAVGGGGVSETSLMGINSEYENSVNQLVNTFNRNKGDVLNDAANQKAQNEAALSSKVMDFQNSTSNNLMELMSTPGVDSDIVQQAISAIGSMSAGTSVVARLRAQGLSDEQIRAMGYAI